DLADLELGAGGVERTRGLAAEVIADDRRGQPFVGDHPILDGMADVDQLGCGGLIHGHFLPRKTIRSTQAGGSERRSPSKNVLHGHRVFNAVAARAWECAAAHSHALAATK